MDEMSKKVNEAAAAIARSQASTSNHPEPSAPSDLLPESSGFDPKPPSPPPPYEPNNSSKINSSISNINSGVILFQPEPLPWASEYSNNPAGVSYCQPTRCREDSCCSNNTEKRIREECSEKRRSSTSSECDGCDAACAEILCQCCFGLILALISGLFK